MWHPGSFDSEETKILKRIPKEILLLSLAGAVIASAINPVTGVFILAGGIFAAVSFLWLKYSISRFTLVKNRKKIIGSFLGNYILRLVLIITVFSIIIIFFSKRIFAFMAGFSTIIIVFLAEAIATLSKMKKWKS